MLAAFEDQNRVRIELSIARWTTNGIPDLSLCAKAWDPEADRRVAKPLAFANVRCLAERVKTTAGVLTYLLYQLDFLLAEHEWDGANNKGA